MQLIYCILSSIMLLYVLDLLQLMEDIPQEKLLDPFGSLALVINHTVECNRLVTHM